MKILDLGSFSSLFGIGRRKLIESEGFKIHYNKSVKVTKIKASNKPANIKTFDKLVRVLKNEGRIQTNNVHRLKEKMHSEFTGKSEDGWSVAWVSRSDDLRIAYRKFGDTIEVKFGKAKDIGYKH